MIAIWSLFVERSLEATLHFSSAYLLVSHGSRDPRPQIAIDHLAKQMRQRLYAQRRQRHVMILSSNGQAIGERGRWEGELPEPNADDSFMPLLDTAVLELAPLPLHEQIRQFAEQAIERGYESIKILPLFLLPGVHVMEDIPAELAIAQAHLEDRIHLQLCPYLGSHADLGQLLLNPVDPFTTSPQTGKILIAHGSRRPGSHQRVEAIAAQLNAFPAYWSQPPSLEDQVMTLIKYGYQQIAILPYFLFEGGITDAIRQAMHCLSQQFPYAKLELAHPIGATSTLADYAVDLLM